MAVLGRGEGEGEGGEGRKGIDTRGKRRRAKYRNSKRIGSSGEMN